MRNVALLLATVFYMDVTQNTQTAPQPTQATAFVSMETEADLIKRNNLHLVSACIGFVWMLFHFTVVFFFTLNLGSPLLVGLFLGLGNIVALLIDIPVSIL